jgi:glycosyltransferase involved in cell wall biosynthesis
VKVVLAVHGFPPLVRGGTELYTYYLAQELLRQGVAVHVFTADRTAAAVNVVSRDGLPRTVVPVRGWRGPSLLGRREGGPERAFLDLLRDFRPDVLHVNHLRDLSLHLPLLAKQAGCRVVYTLHDHWLRCLNVALLDRWEQKCFRATAWKCASCCRARYSRLSWEFFQSLQNEKPRSWKERAKEVLFQLAERPVAWLWVLRRQSLLRRLIAAVDRFIAPTQFLRERMVEWGIPPAKIVGHGHGAVELSCPRRAEQPANRRPRFGYLGGAAHGKGIKVLLEAFRGVGSADLVVCGGRREAMPRGHEDVLQQPNVELIGHVDEGGKEVLLSQLDAVIVPSIWYENSPLVIHEAFQAGVPVICSNIGGMAELVADGVDGLHFQAGNSASLRGVLDRCLREPDLLERLRRGIRKPKSMAEHVSNEILPLYESLLREHQKALAGTHS